MKKLILSVLFVSGWIICARLHWMAMVAYYIILLACIIFLVDVDAWQDRKRHELELLEICNRIVDPFLDDLDLTMCLCEIDPGDDQELMAEAVNDLIMHRILKIVPTQRGLEIGYIID
ncbi:MAG: hypothetical protein AB7D24_10970 [Sphaerochaeta sp.]|jgi:hypothetical protein|uniref:hypothetical protein n=1 Tax=Sphaerochaeta sp. TaxID=1972642 RepID=UPI003D0CCF6B